MNTRIETLKANLAAAKTVREKVDTLNALAWEMRALDNRGQEYADTAYTLAQAEQYPQGIAESLVNQCQFMHSDFVRALSLGSRALALFEQLGDRTGQSRAFLTLCSAYWFADDFAQAIEMGRRAQKLAQETGDQLLEADALNNLGLAYKRSGNFELAITVYTESLARFRAAGEQLHAGKVLTNIALAYAAQGHYDRALFYAGEYERLGIDNPRINGYVSLVRGQVYAGTKDFDQALRYLHQAARYASEHTEHEQLSIVALQTIGQVYIERQEPDLAIAYLQQALTIADEIQSNLYVFRFHELLSQIYESQGDLDRALMHYKQFHAVKEKVFNDNNTRRRQWLEIQHQTEIARHEAEIYHLRNIELEQEITERKRLQEELHQQATTDELTKVFNRRHFLSLAHRELKRALRLNHPVSVALIDLDHFKKINDTYGHAAGDQALRELTKIHQENTRAIDVFARFGGDEFALLLPETDGATAQQVVERVRLALLAQPLNLSGTRVTITISAGIASLEGESDLLDTLIARADQALYRAKEAGRNGVCL